MRTLVMIIAIIFMVACETPDGDRTKKEGYSILTIDGCEYIEVSSMIGSNNGYYSITHKGNCNNPIHHK